MTAGSDLRPEWEREKKGEENKRDGKKKDNVSIEHHCKHANRVRNCRGYVIF